jgi:hypothetical protein
MFSSALAAALHDPCNRFGAFHFLVGMWVAVRKDRCAVRTIPRVRMRSTASLISWFYLSRQFVMLQHRCSSPALPLQQLGAFHFLVGMARCAVRTIPRVRTRSTASQTLSVGTPRCGVRNWVQRHAASRNSSLISAFFSLPSGIVAHRNLITSASSINGSGSGGCGQNQFGMDDQTKNI